MNSFVNFKTRINNGTSILFDFRIQDLSWTRTASSFIIKLIRFRAPWTTTVPTSADNGYPGQGHQNVRLFNKKCRSFANKNINPKKIKWSLYHPRRSKNIDEDFFVASNFKSENSETTECALFEGFFGWKVDNVKKDFANGDYFEGELVNGVRHGKGTYRFKVRSYSST